MKQAFGIFAAIVLVPSMQVHAWVGGPWSNDSYQENGDDGIYEAIGTMTDGTAMYRWAVQNENPGGVAMVGGQANAARTSNVQFGGLIGAASPNVIWYRGLVYYGRCFGIVNSGMKRVMVTANASTTGLNGSAGQLNGVDLNSSQLTPITGTGTQVSARKSVCNSTFEAKINQSHPMKRFHGYGTCSFVGEPVSDLIFVTAPAGGGVQILQVNGSSSSPHFYPEGHRVGMKVFGSQVSTQVTS